IGVVLHWRKDWATALTAGVLLAINPLHVWYSQEVRGYAIMLFFGLCALLSLEWSRAPATKLKKLAEENDAATSGVMQPFVPDRTKDVQSPTPHLRITPSLAYAALGFEHLLFVLEQKFT